MLKDKICLNRTINQLNDVIDMPVKTSTILAEKIFRHVYMHISD